MDHRVAEDLLVLVELNGVVRARRRGKQLVVEGVGCARSRRLGAVGLMHQTSSSSPPGLGHDVSPDRRCASIKVEGFVEFVNSGERISEERSTEQPNQQDTSNVRKRQNVTLSVSRYPLR